MMPEFSPPEASNGTRETPQVLQQDEEMRRTFGIALMLAKESCCDCCRALVRIREKLAANMAVGDDPHHA